MRKALGPVWDKAWKAMSRVDALKRLYADPTEQAKAQRSADAAAAAFAAAYGENAELIAHECNKWNAFWEARSRAEASARLGQPSAEGGALAATAALAAAEAASAGKCA